MDYDTVSEEEWEEIILKFDCTCFFHSPSWAKIVEKTWDYRTATRLYNVNGKSILIPMMEANKFGFKIFTNIPNNADAGGLFSESDITTDDFKSIINDIVGGRNLSFSLAFPPFMKLAPGKSSPINEDWKLKDEFTYTHLIKIEDKNYDDIWNGFHRKTRQKIRKAKKSGVEIKDGTSLGDFKSFYDIYAKESLQKWGYETPQIPFKLCKNLYKFGSDHVKLSLATKDDKIIAGTLSLLYSKTFYLFMSAFLPEYGTFNPTSILFNHAIKQACQEGYNCVNFGTSGNLKQLGKFKEKFGPEKVELERYQVYSNLGRIVSKINKRYRIYSS
jgi:hypothetical protein